MINEEKNNKNDKAKEQSQNAKPSISPSIAEIERFIKFLSKRINAKPFNNLIVLIQKTQPNVKGYFSPNSWKAQAEKVKGEDVRLNAKPQPNNINEICLSSVNLTFEPYETIAHEFAHFLNTHLDKYKGNGRNYHTQDFKKRAESLALRVERGNYGFNTTYETDEFKEMLKEFNPDTNAFKIFQPSHPDIVGIDANGNPIDINGNPIKIEPKSPNRLLKLVCVCGNTLRGSKKGEENKPLCSQCYGEFKTKESDEPKPEYNPSQAEQNLIIKLEELRQELNKIRAEPSEDTPQATPSNEHKPSDDIPLIDLSEVKPIFKKHTINEIVEELKKQNITEEHKVYFYLKQNHLTDINTIETIKKIMEKLSEVKK